MAVKFKTVITKAGAIKLAAATIPNGKKVNLTVMAVGDGGGTLPTPDPNQTKLVNEVWRHALNKISQDNKNKNYVVAELVIPPETGGFWMREMGLYDDTGTLIAVGNMAESYKPALAEGSGRAQTVRMVIMVSDIASVELTIDTTTVMATQDYVDDKLAEHEQSRRHPDASITAKGFTQLSSATDSSSEVLAATPKAVKTVYDLANAKYTAQDASTARKGIVQLSSATDSTSETLAATPKAVKTVYDLANAKYTAQDASTAQKGIVQLSSATDSTSEVLAATPKAVKTVYDLANAKYTAQDASTARKGIVQLSSATDSTSEVLAATPKAVKTVSDELESVKKSLGTAAGKDVVTSTSDNTAGRVLTVGFMGLGSVAGLNVTDANTPNYNCFLKMGSGGIHGPAANAPSNIFQFQYDTNAAQQIGYRAGAADAPMYHRTKINGVWGNWIQVFDTLHPPTAAQVGALSSTGGRLTGNLEIFNDAPIVQLTETDTGAKFFFVVDAKEFRLQEVTTSGDRILSYQYGSKILNTVGQLVPGNYSNFDARYYTKTLAEATFQPKGSYGKPSSYKISGNILWTQDGDTGVIEMTGQVGTTNGGARITFPYAFASKCYSVQMTSVASSGAGTALAAYNIDTTGFTLQIAGGGSVAFSWTAKGI